MKTLEKFKAVSFCFRCYWKVSEVGEVGDDWGRWVWDFLALPQGVFTSELVYLLYVECLQVIKPMAFVFVILEFDATLDDGREIWELAQLLVNKMLFQDLIDGYMKY